MVTADGLSHPEQDSHLLGMVAAGVAHDFNNLLTAINTYAEIVRLDLPADHPSQKELSEIRCVVEQGSRLAQQLLMFGRTHHGACQLLQMTEVVTEMEPMLRQLAGPYVDLDIVMKPHLPRIQADRSQLEQVIVNLCVNARDAMPAGGGITLSLSPIGGTTQPSGVLLSVSDTGHGMSDAVKERMFEPFFTTKRDGKGTGLGLATVRDIVRRCGGSISVSSALGAGTVMQIAWPRADSD